MKKMFTVFAVLVIALSAVAAAAMLALRTRPQYSLAMMVAEAHVPGGHGVERYVDVDSVVDTFIPQVRDKAVELYGRGISADTIARFERLAEPLKPMVRERAKTEVRSVLKEDTVRFKRYPSILLAAGIWWRTSEVADGDRSVVTVSDPSVGRVELVMVRADSRWRIVEVRHPMLAEKVAGAVGQEIFAMAAEEGLDGIARVLAVRDVDELVDRIDEAMR
jgi:hypothetical protein